MIITDIKAENILKYSRLELHDLPESGIIAIDGPNESGKSSVGETICFALFGRTFSLGPDELEKLIRWGETHCSAWLRFRVGDGEHVFRSRLCIVFRGVVGVAPGGHFDIAFVSVFEQHGFPQV